MFWLRKSTTRAWILKQLGTIFDEVNEEFVFDKCNRYFFLVKIDASLLVLNNLVKFSNFICIFNVLCLCHK